MTSKRQKLSHCQETVSDLPTSEKQKDLEKVVRKGKKSSDVPNFLVKRFSAGIISGDLSVLAVTIYLKLEQMASRSIFFVAADMNRCFDRYFEMRVIFWFFKQSTIFAPHTHCPVTGHTNLSKLNAALACKIFDTMISPILTYNSEIWGVYAKPDFKTWDGSQIEKAHLQFCKRYLEVNNKASI